MRTRFLKKAPLILPITLGRKQIYILPTRQGMIFLLVLGAMLVGSANYNNNPGFLLTFLLGGMSFVSILHTHRNLSGLEIREITALPLFAGETAEFRVSLRNPGPARPSLSLYFAETSEKQIPLMKMFFQLFTSGSSLPKTRIPLLESGENSIAVHLVSERRGILKPGPLYIATRYPMGIFRAWSRLDVDSSCLVYPKPLSGTHEAGYGADVAGHEDTGSGVIPGADDFQGLRPWLPGEPVQRISWKTFSRGQGLLIKEFVMPTGSVTTIDWEMIRSDDTEYRLSRLCGMVLKAGRDRMRYGLKLPGISIAPDQGEVHRHTCLRTLALFGTGER